MFFSIIEDIVHDHKGGGSFDTFRRDMLSLLGQVPEISEHDFQKKNSLTGQYLFAWV